MKFSTRHILLAATAFGLSALLPATASAQVSTLNKGQTWFLKNGLQVQGLSTNFDPWDLTIYQNANYTAVNWLWDSNVTLQGSAPGAIPWARVVRPPTNWGDITDNGEAPPRGSESGYMSKLIALSLGDEPNLNDDALRTNYVNWFNRMSPLYPNQLLSMNNYGGQVTDGPLADFISRAHPDMISFDTYPYRYNIANDPNQVRVQPAGGSPTNWYGDLRRYRQHAYDNNIPLGIYRQTYHSTTEGVRDTSDSELRLMTFASMAFNVKYFTDFTYNSGASSMYGSVGQGQAPNAYYNSVKQINAEARNLGPAMVRLKPIPAWNVDQTTNILIIHGRHDIGGGANAFNANPVGFANDPEGGAAYTQFDNFTQHNDPYLTGWGITNLGTKNSGLKGDVIISWFQPLDEWFDGDDWNDERYMMVVNGLADMDGTGAETKQQIILSFGSSTSGVKFPYTYIQRLNRLTGQVENVPVTSVDSFKKNVTFIIEGGTGDLFKFPDGAPFVGTLPPDQTWKAGTGAFANNGQWDDGLGGGASPNGNYFAHFGPLASGSTYTVNFAGNVASTGAFVHRDNTTFNLGGFTYTLNGFTGVDSLIVGMYAGENAQLTLGNGSLNVAASATNFSQVGKAAGSSGIITVGAGGKWINAPTLLVGKLGNGTVNVNASLTASPNGAASFSNVYLGGSTTAAGGSGVLNANGGSIGISGTLKVWNSGSSTINLSAGTLAVGTLDTNGNPARLNFTGGTLDLTASSLTLGSGPISSLSLSANKTLRVSGVGSTFQNSPGSLVSITGGKLYGRDIDLTTGGVTFTSGTIEIDGGPLKIGASTATYGGGITGTGSLTKSGNNSITLTGPNNFTGSTNVAAGSLIFATSHLTSPLLNVSDNATAQFATGGSNILRTGSINTNTSGRVDLGDNPAIIDYDTTDPIAQIRAMIQSGYNNGSWNGTGIMSSSAQTSPVKTAIGYAEASNLFGSFPTIYAGQTIDSTTIVTRFTVAGDANFSGKTDIQDFNRLASNFGKTNKTWYDGDFDYNGTVNIMDFNILAAAFGKYSPNQAPPQAMLIFAAEHGATAAVPLPAAVYTGAVGLLLSAYAAHRARRRR
jgi:autotransporter-associated beta strand protein/T5SS/PEP-CTERM-associated repeat protein